MPPKINLTGKTFNRLTVIRYKENKKGKRWWECVCICGNKTTAATDSLQGGNTGSCGCYKRSGLHKTHGLSKLSEFRIWAGITKRCYNSNSPAFKRYGGRGITMSPEWRASFKNFYDDIGPRPTKKHTVERTDTNGPYAGWNCRWATRTEQARNTRRNHLLTFNSKTLCLAEWAEELGMGYGTLQSRISRHWPIEKAFFTPVNHNMGPQKHQGWITKTRKTPDAGSIAATVAFTQRTVTTPAEETKAE